MATQTHRDRRSAFIQAAIEVIAEKGLDRVRLADVARAVGVTTGSLTYHFEDKDQLLIAAFEVLAEQLIARTPDSGGTITAVLERSLAVDEEGRRATRVWAAYFGRALVNDAMAEILREYYREIRTRLVAILDNRTRCPRERLPALADNIIAQIDGILIRALFDPGEWPPEAQVQHLETAIRALVQEAESHAED